ncbi:MerR family transcriptional regulator [Cytobacillus sp. FJAT-54145]|uniref:MerR family transcriptional regulator n=1 Tax=Cytobacillus spartinae TaxID=3299023 RepID=A0ABW6K980_9BACI
MTLEHPTYSIKQASEITGLSKQVLRKWEERYEIIIPERLENGYRIYSEANINSLLRVKRLVDQGYTVKQAALIVEKEESSSDQSSDDSIWQTENSFQVLNDYVLELLKEGTNLSEVGMNYILQQAYHEKGLEDFIHTVVIPFLCEIGSRLEKGEWEEYQEAIASMVVRDFLVQLRRNYKYRDNAPTILGACLPNELHEVPVMLLLLLAMLKGWKTVFVGATPAEGSIEKTIEKLQPNRVVLSAITTVPFEKDPNLLLKLDQFAANIKHTSFYIGGPGTYKFLTECKVKLRNIQYTDSLDEILG